MRTLRIQEVVIVYDDIYIRIKENRRRMGMTQAELGTMIGVQKSAIQKYESGSNHYKLETIIKLAQAFEISVSSLIGESHGESEMEHTMLEMYGAKGLGLLEVFSMLDEGGRIKVLTYAFDILPTHGSHTTTRENGDGI
ncbi:MAG: helix-turn-helix transcriptional regulator [Bacteroidaceae bacterium]|nr:helix-turn-helix transcriptional regulator [Bacteroidaceae bacterium]